MSDEDAAVGEWPGLAEARVVAAQLGAPTVGTQHVLLALLSGPEDDATRALRGAGVDFHAIAVALEAVVGSPAHAVPSPPVGQRLSRRVEQLLLEARRRVRVAADRDGTTNPVVDDHDVLAALLDSDDESVANLVMTYIGARRRALDGLQELAATGGPALAS